MKKIFVVLISIFLSSAISAELTEQQMLNVSKKIIEETLNASKLSGDYKLTLKNHLEKIMYNEQIVSLLTKIASENSVTSNVDAEKIGFNVMSGLRDKSLLTLSNNELYELLKLNVNIVTKMTDYECAQYVKKRRTDEGGLGRGIYEISGQLNIATFKKYIGYYDKAIQNLVSNKSSSEKLSEGEVQIVKSDFRELMAELTSKNVFVKEFFASGKSFADSSDSDVCRVSKELLKVVVSGDVEKAKKRTSAYINGQLY
jgi:hypothetical protein